MSPEPRARGRARSERRTRPLVGELVALNAVTRAVGIRIVVVETSQVCYRARCTITTSFFMKGGCAHELSGSAGGQKPLAAKQRAVPPACRASPRIGRPPAPTHRKALPLGLRTIRRSHNQETKARSQRSDGADGPRVR